MDKWSGEGIRGGGAVGWGLGNSLRIWYTTSSQHRRHCVGLIYRRAIIYTYDLYIFPFFLVSTKSLLRNDDWTSPTGISSDFPTQFSISAVIGLYIRWKSRELHPWVYGVLQKQLPSFDTLIRGDDESISFYSVLCYLFYGYIQTNDY